MIISIVFKLFAVCSFYIWSYYGIPSTNIKVWLIFIVAPIIKEHD